MLPFFPFEEEFDPGMGMRVLQPDEPLCHVDSSRYRQETMLKERLLTEAHDYYFRGGPDTIPAQWDVLELAAADLARRYPEWFHWRSEGEFRHWENTLTGLPQEMYQFWDRHLRPLGYRIRVKVVDFSGGMPGDIGLTLKWG